MPILIRFFHILVVIVKAKIYELLGDAILDFLAIPLLVFVRVDRIISEEVTLRIFRYDIDKQVIRTSFVPPVMQDRHKLPELSTKLAVRKIGQ